jgi:hypothetical protein
MLIKILIWLTIKHWCCDWLLQTPFQYLNKGKYGHPGGLLHVVIAMLGSLYVITLLDGDKPVPWVRDYHHPASVLMRLMITLVAIEGLIHYHCDWAKENICRWAGWHANNSEWYWRLIGLTQGINQITYIGMAYFYCNGV